MGRTHALALRLCNLPLLGAIIELFVEIPEVSAAKPEVIDVAPVADKLGEMSELDQAVFDYLSEAGSTLALMISGQWGSGKTYFVTTRGPRIATLAGKRLISMSAAGTSSREELDQNLFLAAAPLFQSGTVAALGVFAKAGMRWLKIDPEDLRLKAGLSEGQVAVVVDDVERYSGDFKTLFGFIVDLIDKHRVHVILVASEEMLLRINPDNGPAVFGAWKEKIVGRTVHVAPNSKFIVSTILDEIADASVVDRLKPHVDCMSNVIECWGMENLRAAKQAIRGLCRLIAESGRDRFDRLETRQAVLVDGVLIGLLECARDAASVPKVARFFDHADLALAAHLSVSESAVVSDEKRYFSDLGGRYEETKLALFPGGAAISKFFRSGVVDADGIFRGLELLPKEPGPRDLLLTEYFKLSDEDFAIELSRLVGDLRTYKLSSTGEILSAYGSLRHFQDQGLIQLSAEEIESLVIDSIRNLPEPALGDLDWGEHEITFFGQDDPGQVRVKNEVSVRYAAARQRSISTEQERLFDSFSNSMSDLPARLQKWKTEPLFVGSPDKILDALERLGPHQLQDVVRLFGARKRISNIAEAVRAEKQTLLEVATLIDERMSQGSPTLSNAQMSKVARVMKEFAAILERDVNK